MLRAGSKLLALSLTLAHAGCSAALSEPFTPPESGGAPWVEVTSKHIVLRTDLPEDEARDVCIEFERIYTMFEDIAFPYSEKPKAQTTIVLFRREAEYEAIGPNGSIGYFHRALAMDDYFEPTAVFYGDLTAATRLTFQHELTHRFIDFYFPKAPVWLDEGMAEYFETMVVEDGHVVLGRDLPNRFFIGGLTWTFESTPLWPVIAHIPISDAVSAGDLIKMGREEFYAARAEASSPSEKEQRNRRQVANYASAWGLVNLFQNGPAPYPSRFATYLEKLSVNMDPASAFRDAFGGVDDTLERDDKAWLKPKERIIRRAPYVLPAADIASEHEMAPADVHVLWASIRPWASDAHRARARADLDAAIRLDPNNVSARVWMAQLCELTGEIDEAESHHNVALAAAPGNPAATYALFRLLVRQAVAARGRRPLCADGRDAAEALIGRDDVPRAEWGGSIPRAPAARRRRAAARAAGGSGRSELLAMLRHAGVALGAEGRV